jgi:hypothetical protein
MTQELVLAGLLSGLVGLAWVMRIAVGQSKHAAEPTREPEHSDNSDQVQHRQSALTHQTTAA